MTSLAALAYRHDGKLTLALLALSLALAYGVWYAYSVILVALLHEFGWSRSVLAGAFSLFAIIHGLCNPVIGHLCDRVRPALLMTLGGIALGLALYANSFISKPWHLYVGLGGFTALAVALCGWAPAVVQVQRRFQHRLGFALGIVSSGIGVGMLLVVPLCQVLIDAAGWRVAFRMLALICAGCIVPAALYLWFNERRLEHVNLKRAAAGSGAATAVGVTLRTACRTWPFWLMVATFFFGSVCSQTLHVHQVAYLVDHGIAALTAAAVVGVVGAASVAGKTGGGWLSDRMEREVVYIAGIAILVASVVALQVAGNTASTAGAYVYAVMLGVGYSATAAIVPAMMSDWFQGRHFGSILGIGLFGSASGSALGPWMAGRLFDVTGTYRLPFLIAAISGCLAGLAVLLARVLRRRRAHATPGAGGAGAGHAG